MNGELTGLGVGGIFAMLVIREVLGFLRAKKINGGPPPPIEIKCPMGSEEDIREMQDQINELYKWHAVEDPNTGIKKWYLTQNHVSDMKTVKSLVEKIAAKVGVRQ